MLSCAYTRNTCSKKMSFFKQLREDVCPVYRSPFNYFFNNTGYTGWWFIPDIYSHWIWTFNIWLCILVVMCCSLSLVFFLLLFSRRSILFSIFSHTNSNCIKTTNEYKKKLSHRHNKSIEKHFFFLFLFYTDVWVI